MDPIIRIASVTGVDVELKVAGPGGRSYAFIIDWHIRFVAAIAWWFVGTIVLVGTSPFSIGSPSNELGAAYAFIVAMPAIAIYFLYHPVLELALRGQTPGKRMAGVRLVNVADGGAPGVGALLIRNAFRLVDSLPFMYGVGLVTTMLTKHAVRIGDLAAGTVLVYDERQNDALLEQLDSRAIARLGLAQAQLARELIQRWPQLAPRARAQLASEVLAKAGVAATGDEIALRAQLEQLLA